MASIPAPRHRYTFVEYLELEEVARVRHELFGSGADLAAYPDKPREPDVRR